MLPAPWDQNPHVVIVMAPVEAEYSARQTPDGALVFGCLKHGDDYFGLQVLKPVTNTYAEQRRIFNSTGADMIVAAYQGPLSNVPQKLLLSCDFEALVLNPQKMSGEYLNLRRALRAVAIPGVQ